MSATPFPDELLVGAPGESLGGATRAGAITFWTPGTVQYLHQDSAGIPGVAETGDASEHALPRLRGGHGRPADR